MQMPDLKLTNINGVELEIYDTGGDGEPVVFVHGAMGDECYAVIQEPALTDRFRVVLYMRRGWSNSTTDGLPLTIAQQAEDCRAVMRHLGIEKAHLAGVSYGGTILLQFAVDFPETVHTLALMEPGLPSVLETSAEYGEAMAAVGPLLEAGDIEGTLNALFETIAPGFRSRLDETLPAGWYERWLADCERVNFPHDVPELNAWQFTGEDAAKITAPVLNMTGAKTASFFTDVHNTLQSWIPHAERAVVPDSTHAMPEEQPKASAELLAGFFSRHPMPREAVA
jgi:pimeloyl-ACP methyl ester carboxylesterase